MFSWDPAMFTFAFVTWNHDCTPFLLEQATFSILWLPLQIAKAMGAHVTTTCSTRNVDFVTNVLGADVAIDYTKVRRLTSAAVVQQGGECTACPIPGPLRYQ